jgi:hypothetical protein
MPMSMQDWTFSRPDPWESDARDNRRVQMRGQATKLPKSGDRALEELPEDMQIRYGKNEGWLLDQNRRDRKDDERQEYQDFFDRQNGTDQPFEVLMREILSGPPKAKRHP